MAIARVALPLATHQLFDYWVPDGLAVLPGSLLRVRLGGRTLVGVVDEIAAKAAVEPERLQPIRELVGDIPPLPDDLRALARFMANYYQTPIGQCYAQMLPPLPAAREEALPLAPRYVLSANGRIAVRDTLPARAPRQRALANALDASEGVPVEELRAAGAHAWRLFSQWRRDGWVEAAPLCTPRACGPIALNADQHEVLAMVLAQPLAFRPSLLQGVTGSGKTEVYLSAAARVIADGRQALLLVPEINLTPQLEQRIAIALPDIRVATLHSGLAASERRRNWLAAARGEAQLIVGTRLGVFAPAPRLGLIVVDEEHDPSFKQQDGVRYHARDVAVYRARLRDLPVLLGSATPSMESYRHAQLGHYRCAKLTRRATGSGSLPPVRLAPNRTPDSVEGIGPVLRDAIAARLERGEQTLLFVNRRGFAPSLLCVACGWKAMCTRCSARLVLHAAAGELRCHHCGFSTVTPSACPDCGNQDLLPLGFGTQRLERALSVMHPGARVLRVDRDSTQRRGAFDKMRTAIAEGEVDILVGTQMLAKGHDFPRLTLVGVLGADNALYSAQLRASERLFALLEQAGGRAGRRELPGQVIVQTDFPEHPLYSALVAHDYDRFAAQLLAEREAAGLPPFAYLALLAAEARSGNAVNAFLEAASQLGRRHAASRAGGCEVHSPVPAALARKAGLERGQVLIQSAERRALQEFLPQFRGELERLDGRKVRWILDVDPLDFA